MVVVELCGIKAVLKFASFPALEYSFVVKSGDGFFHFSFYSFIRTEIPRILKKTKILFWSYTNRFNDSFYSCLAAGLINGGSMEKGH